MSENMHSFAEAVKICLPFAAEVQKKWKSAYQCPQKGVSGQNDAKITCFKGCGACCHYAVISSSSIEAFVLLSGWLGHGENLQAIHARCLEYVERFDAARKRVGHFPFSLAARRKFMSEKLACPAFQPTPSSENRLAGHCGVYGDRPVICSQFHSTSDPKLCTTVQTHGTIEELMQSGEEAAFSLRVFERMHFGKSALGHLPLLVAALTTQSGLNAFLRRDLPPDFSASEPPAQELADFAFYSELLECIGITLAEPDFNDLALAQAESCDL